MGAFEPPAPRSIGIVKEHQINGRPAGNLHTAEGCRDQKRPLLLEDVSVLQPSDGEILPLCALRENPQRVNCALPRSSDLKLAVLPDAAEPEARRAPPPSRR